MAKVEIKTKGVVTHIYVDGKPVEGVRHFSVTQDALRCPILNLEIMPTDLTVDGNTIPELPEIYKSFYERKSAPDGAETEEC